MTARQYPETLILEPGATVEGRFQRLERGTTRDGEERAIAVITVGDVERSLWLHELALRAKFAQLKPEPGELIRIVKGAEKKLGGAGRMYWPFSVTAPDRPDETVGWDDPLLAAEDPAAGGPPKSDVPLFDGSGQPPAKSGTASGDADIDDIPF